MTLESDRDHMITKHFCASQYLVRYCSLCIVHGRLYGQRSSIGCLEGLGHGTLDTGPMTDIPHYSGEQGTLHHTLCKEADCMTGLGSLVIGSRNRFGMGH